ncbi:MAG: PIG-L family deacetylase [Clostridia bacterium]|nr:PIG-L family deacetylase [Clostridia bacterium]
MSETKYVFFFSPHQDDELLNLGAAMCRDIDAGREVFCVLCTDGGASGARRLIGDGETCEWHGDRHDYPMDRAAFSAARDGEFTASCRFMGLQPDHILIPADRAPDGQLTAEHAEKLMRDAIKGFPAEQVTLKTLAEVKWQQQNPDHTAVARAALQLRAENACAAVEEYLETILFPAPEGTDILETLTPDAAQKERLQSAAAQYGRWEPKNGFYAVGRHSVWDEFDEFRKEQFSRLMIRR